MKMTFRWFGEKDPVSLQKIRQIPGLTGVVTALYDQAPGEVWNRESVRALKRATMAAGLNMEVIESVPVHEDIKLGIGRRDEYIQNYCQNIRVLAEEGVKCICYNFMPVFDWVRTELHSEELDGSDALSYRHSDILKLDPMRLSLPGWDESYAPEKLRELLEQYRVVTHEKLFENLVYFLQALVPTLEECGVNMAIHPDDPPWDLLGLPRIITSEENLDKLFSAVPFKRNCLTFCTGSLGTNPKNDLKHMAAKYAGEGRIVFAHLRNIKYTGEYSFAETGHKTECGSLEMYGIVKELVENGFQGYVRPDHGRNIWGETGKPGYGLYDRALGACYLSGLFEAIEKDRGNV